MSNKCCLLIGAASDHFLKKSLRVVMYLFLSGEDRSHSVGRGLSHFLYKSWTSVCFPLHFLLEIKCLTNNICLPVTQIPWSPSHRKLYFTSTGRLVPKNVWLFDVASLVGASKSKLAHRRYFF